MSEADVEQEDCPEGYADLEAKVGRDGPIACSLPELSMNCNSLETSSAPSGR